jgi:carbon storage regulator
MEVLVNVRARLPHTGSLDANYHGKKRLEPPTKESIMLVLSRKKNESIIINDDITIVVVEIRGDKVRLGVEAPKEVPVHRNEVYEAIRRNQLKQDAGEQPVSQNDSSNAGS